MLNSHDEIKSSVTYLLFTLVSFYNQHVYYLILIYSITIIRHSLILQYNVRFTIYGLVSYYVHLILLLSVSYNNC